MIVKVLGGIDVAAAIGFLFIIFGFDLFTPYLLACAGLLFLKGLFILTGNILSILDLFASLMLLLCIFFVPPLILLWIPAFLLLAKGLVSFI